MDFSKTMGVFTPLIDFSLLVDIDFGILNLIDRKYLDRDTFSVDWFNNHHKINKMVEVLCTREKWNPLSLCSLLDEEQTELLYFEFISKPEYYKQVLECSMITEIYNLVEKFNLSGDITTTIFCENELEAEVLKKLRVTKNLNILIESKDLQLSRYNQIFIKDSKSRILLDLVSDSYSKTIYIANYPYNISDNGEFKDEKFELLQAFRNNVRIIDVYDLNKLKGEVQNG